MNWENVVVIAAAAILIGYAIYLSSASAECEASGLVAVRPVLGFGVEYVRRS